VNSNVGVLADSFIDTSVTQSCRQRTPRCLIDLRHDSSDVVTSTLRGLRKNSTVSSLWLMTAQSRWGCWNHLLSTHHVIVQSSLCTGPSASVVLRNRSVHVYIQGDRELSVFQQCIYMTLMHAENRLYHYWTNRLFSWISSWSLLKLVPHPCGNSSGGKAHVNSIYAKASSRLHFLKILKRSYFRVGRGSNFLNPIQSINSVTQSNPILNEDYMLTRIQSNPYDRSEALHMK